MENEKVAEAIDDDALFDQLASNAPATAQEQQTEVEEQPEPQAKAPDPEPPQIEQPKQEPHRVPLNELLDERERRKAAEARAAEYERREKERAEAEKAKQAPDWFENPDEALGHRVQRAVDPALQRLQQIEERIARQNEQMSQMSAQQQYGAETVNKAYQAFDALVRTGDPAAQAEYSRIMSSPHPYGALVEWHQTQEAIKAYRDPNAVRERFLSDPDFLKAAMERLQQQAGTRAPVVSIPAASRKSAALPSVSQMGAAAPIGGDGSGEDDDALFERMSAKKR